MSKCSCEGECRLAAQAGNPHTAAFQLAEMASTSASICDYSSELDELIARNPSTDEATLVLLAQGGDTATREAVAENTKTPVEALEILANDEHPFVRISVSEHPNTPPDLLENIDRSDWEDFD